MSFVMIDSTGMLLPVSSLAKIFTLVDIDNINEAIIPQDSQTPLVIHAMSKVAVKFIATVINGLEAVDRIDMVIKTLNLKGVDSNYEFEKWPGAANLSQEDIGYIFERIGKIRAYHQKNENVNAQLASREGASALGIKSSVEADEDIPYSVVMPAMTTQANLISSKEQRNFLLRSEKIANKIRATSSNQKDVPYLQARSFLNVSMVSEIETELRKMQTNFNNQLR